MSLCLLPNYTSFLLCFQKNSPGKIHGLARSPTQGAPLSMPGGTWGTPGTVPMGLMQGPPRTHPGLSRGLWSYVLRPSQGGLEKVRCRRGETFVSYTVFHVNSWVCSRKQKHLKHSCSYSFEPFLARVLSDLARVADPPHLRLPLLTVADDTPSACSGFPVAESDLDPVVAHLVEQHTEHLLGTHALVRAELDVAAVTVPPQSTFPCGLRGDRDLWQPASPVSSVELVERLVPVVKGHVRQ